MIQIKKEFQELIPKLSEDEFRQLEQNILDNGIRDAICTWNGYIIDGHNRFEIAEKHGLQFKTLDIQLESEDDVKVWMVSNQLGRRNISDWLRYELAQVKEEILKRRGKVEMQKKGKEGGRGNKKGLPNIGKPLSKHNTRQELANDLGWSGGKVSMAQKIAKKAPEEIKEKLRSGEMSINQAYQEIKQKNKPETLFTAESPEELLKKAKEVAKERAEEKRAKIEEKGSTPDVPEEDQDLIERMKTGQTVVLNMNRNFHAMKYANDNDLFVRIDRFSEWGNPYHIESDGDRDYVCDSYQIYFERKKGLHSKITQLKGKALGCHCYPKRCHGDHLKKLADG